MIKLEKIDKDIQMGTSTAGRKRVQRVNHPFEKAKPYVGFSLKDTTSRPNALYMLTKPSRYGSKLNYPNIKTGEN